MLLLRRAFALTLLAVAAVVFAACAGASSAPQRMAVPIADVKAVAGKWAGTFARDTSAYENWVELTISEDGTYEFSSVRQIGSLQGKGTLRVNDGKLVAEGPRGSIVYTLYDKGGKQVLMLNASTSDGATYSGELGRAR